MPTPAVLTNLVLYSGEDKIFQDQIYQSDGQTKQDITGWGLLFRVHTYGDPTAVLILKTNLPGGGITVSGPAAGGLVNISVASADSINIFPGAYEWEVERTDTPASTVVSRGVFTVQKRGSW